MSKTITFKSVDEMVSYLKPGGYMFLEPQNGDIEFLDVRFDFDFSVDTDITAGNISAKSIKALDINATGIEAEHILCEYLEVGKGNIECTSLLANKDIEANNIYVSSFFTARDIEATNVTACFIRAGRVKVSGILNAEFIDLWKLGAGKIEVTSRDSEMCDFDLRYIYIERDENRKYKKFLKALTPQEENPVNN